MSIITDKEYLRIHDRLMLSYEVPMRKEIADEKDRYIETAALNYSRTGRLQEKDTQVHMQNMSVIFTKYYKRVMQAMSTQVERMAFRGMPKAARLPWIECKFEFYELLLSLWLTQWGAKKVQQTSETTYLDVSSALTAALASELPEDDVIRSMLKVKGFSNWRSATIARTEMHAAAMYASEESAKKISAESELRIQKRWVPVTDGRTRDAHIAMLGSKSIPMDAKFKVNGEALSRPSDPAGSASNTINCRCVLVYENDLFGDF